MLEESEQEAERSPHDLNTSDMGNALGGLLVWLLEAKTLSAVGFRARILTHKLRPDLIDGMTLEQIAAETGHGRSYAHKLSKALSATLGVKGMHDRSEEARKKYREAWHRANPGYPFPHTYNPCLPSKTTSRQNGRRK